MHTKTLSLALALAALLVVSTVPAEAANLLVTTAPSTSRAPTITGEYTTSGETNDSTFFSQSVPYDIAVSGNSFFVLNYYSGRAGTPNSGTIQEYTITGAGIIGGVPNLVSGLNNPRSLAVSGNNLFVTSINGTVGRYDATTGAAVNASLISGLGDTFSIAVSGNNLFVSNSRTGTVGVYDANTGNAINASLISGLSNPRGIAVSGSSLFVTNSLTGIIGEYIVAGGAVVGGNNNLISGLNNPIAIAVSGNSLFVANNNANGTIGEYTTSGEVINASLISGLYNPYSIAVVDVPEPSSVLGLLGFGTIGGFAFIRRRRSNK